MNLIDEEVKLEAIKDAILQSHNSLEDTNLMEICKNAITEALKYTIIKSSPYGFCLKIAQIAIEEEMNTRRIKEIVKSQIKELINNEIKDMIRKELEN